MEAAALADDALPDPRAPDVAAAIAQLGVDKARPRVPVGDRGWSLGAAGQRGRGQAMEAMRSGHVPRARMPGRIGLKPASQERRDAE